MEWLQIGFVRTGPRTLHSCYMCLSLTVNSCCKKALMSLRNFCILGQILPNTNILVDQYFDQGFDLCPKSLVLSPIFNYGFRQKLNNLRGWLTLSHRVISQFFPFLCVLPILRSVFGKDVCRELNMFVTLSILFSLIVKCLGSGIGDNLVYLFSSFFSFCEITIGGYQVRELQKKIDHHVALCELLACCLVVQR